MSKMKGWEFYSGPCIILTPGTSADRILKSASFQSLSAYLLCKYGSPIKCSEDLGVGMWIIPTNHPELKLVIHPSPVGMSHSFGYYVTKSFYQKMLQEELQTRLKPTKFVKYTNVTDMMKKIKGKHKTKEKWRTLKVGSIVRNADLELVSVIRSLKKQVVCGFRKIDVFGNIFQYENKKLLAKYLK